VVIKVEDMRKYLSSELIGNLTDILEVIADGRAAEGKERYNSYIVCNQDEVYANVLWDLILTYERMKKKGGELT